MSQTDFQEQLERIVGHKPDPDSYAGQLAGLLWLALKEDPDDPNMGAHVCERVVSAFQSTLNAMRLTDRGFSMVPWPEGQDASVDTGKDYPPLELENPYALTRGDAQVVGFEPYGLGPDEVQALARLADQGFYVGINARCLHHPGATLGVEIIDAESLAKLESEQDAHATDTDKSIGMLSGE